MLVSVQALRALAAWLVVMHHVMQIFFDFKGDSVLGQLLVEKGAVGVDIFFVISGLVIYLSTQGRQQSPGHFMLNRILRIAPAYWLYSALMALLLLFAPALMPGQQGFELTHFIQSLLFIPAENPGGFGLFPTLSVGWTLNYEMLFYLLLSLTFLLGERYRLLMVGATLVLVSDVLAPAGVVSSFYGNAILYEFLLGVAIGMGYRRGWIVPRLWLPLLALGIALTALYLLDSSQRLVNWGLPCALIVVAGVSLEEYFKGNRVLKVLGDWSYSVYLLHVLVLSVGYALGQRYGLQPYGVIGVCLLLTLLGSWVSFELVEKHLHRHLKALLAASPRSAPTLQLSRQEH